MIDRWCALFHALTDDSLDNVDTLASREDQSVKVSKASIVSRLPPEKPQATEPAKEGVEVTHRIAP